MGQLALCLAILLGAATLGTAQTSSSTCRVEVVLSPPWTNQADNSTLVSVNLNVFNTGPVAIATPWVLTLTNKYYGSVQQTFNLQYLNASAGTFNGQATNFFQTIVPNGGAAAVGLIIAASSGTGMPETAAVNGLTCVVTLAPPPPPPPPSSGAIESGGQLTTSNGQIIGLDGNPLYLLGLNYFGFDDGNTMVDGLWVGSESITQDFATIVYRQQLLGFNAVRLPFSFSIFDDSPKTQTYQCTQDSASVITASTVAPGANPSVSPPSQTFTPSTVPGVCNSYLPEDTSLNRFLFVINFYAQNNFYIILDNQFNLDQTAINNQQQWLQRWTSLMTQLTQQYPNAAARCLLDLLNEPDAFNLQWQAQSGLPGVGDLYLAAMDAIYPVNGGVLFLIEGAGQNGLAMNWGDGIASDPAIISSKGISDTNPFFKSLLQKPYLNQVVAAPHVYPPSISKATQQTTGTGLWQRLSQSFGYLNKQGYCTGSNTVGSPSGTCHLFPTIIGETGTDFAGYCSGANRVGSPSGTCHKIPVLIGETGSDFQGSTDTLPMSDFALWCNNQGGAADGLHNAVSGVFWWAWNANSGDTKGLVEDDWQTVRWDKIAWLQSVGLKPWYAPGVSKTDSPAASPPPPSSPPPLQPPPAAAPPPVFPPPPVPVVQPPATTTTVTTPPPPLTFAQNPPTPPPPSANGVLGDAYSYPGPPPPAGQQASGAIESAASPLQRLKTENGIIYGVDGLSVSFIGVAWYGFDNGSALTGLVGDESISLDFATQVQRIVSLGFNTIELPFSFKSLLAGAPVEIQTECTATSYQTLKDDTNPPSIVLPYGTMFPNLTASPSISNDSCNTYIPSDSTLSRFAYIVNFITANGLYVRLDNRLDLDQSAIQNPQSWLTSWTTLISTLSQNEDTSARLLISPLTNPDIGGIQWKAVNGAPGAEDLYVELMDALYKINPNMLFLVQGPSQLNLTGIGGSSYVTNIPLQYIPDNKIDDPNAFFKQVLIKPYVSQVVIAPRVLAPSLAGTSNSSSGAALFNRLSTSFGYLNKQGYCVNQQCRTFAIAVSGFGSPFTTSQDSGFESDFVSWLTNANIANDNLHNPVSSFFWNGWDSSSYGPLLAKDSVTLDYTKLDFLSGLGLSPWYFAPTAHRTAPVIPATYQNTSLSGAFCGATTSVSLAGASNSTANGSFLGSVAVTLVNTGAISVTPPWTVTLVSTVYTGISQAFGLTQPQSTADGVSGIASDSWNILWPESTNQVTLGFVVVATNQSFTPDAVQINGANCKLSQGGSGASASAPTSLTGGSLGGAESVGSGVTSLSQNVATSISTAPVAAAGQGGTR